MSEAAPYVTSSELADYLRVGDSSDEVAMGLAVAAASRAVEGVCRRRFDQTASARVFGARLDSHGRYVVDVGDVLAVTAVAADWAGDGGFATPALGWTLGPAKSAGAGTPYTYLVSRSLPLAPDSVRVTGTWGWAAVPDTVRAATLLQASRFLARRDSPYGVAGSPEAGSELRLLARVDPDVAVMLRDYVRRWWVVA